jgi:phage tail-like protein
MAVRARATGAGRYAIELDGINAGWTYNVEGGHAEGEVVTEKLGPDHIARKHAGGVKYTDITVSCGTGMSKAFYNWCKDSFDHKHTRKNGAVIAADYDFKENSRLTFYNALVTEIGMLALDVVSKDLAKMTIKFKPEITRQTSNAAGGASIAGKYAADAKVQKKWLPANFRLQIDGLDEACVKVKKIEALVIKQKVTENPIGQERDAQIEPTSLEMPNLTVTVPESHADVVYKWHEDFIIKGNNGQDKEKGGTLVYLTPNLQEELFVLKFFNLGIFKCAPDKVESHADNLRTVKFEMYCEEIKFEYKAAWA